MFAAMSISKLPRSMIIVSFPDMNSGSFSREHERIEVRLSLNIAEIELLYTKFYSFIKIENSRDDNALKTE